MASGIERLNKLISKDAEKKAEETLEKRYGTYTYDKDAKGFTKTNTAANNNSAADNKSNTNASSSTRNTAKTSSTVSRNASGVERLNKLITSDADKKAEEKLSKRYGSYSYNKERNGYTKTEVADNAASTPASIPTYTPSADRKSKEEVEALRNRRDEVEKKLKQLNAEYYNYQDNTAENKWMLDDWAEKKGVTALEAELEALDRELEPYKYDDYLENAYDNTFIGRFKANYGQGRLAQDSSAAWNEYLNNPTEENMQKALYIDYVLGQFANNNAETLGEDGWVSKSFAGYAPQLIDQSIASAKGAGVAVGGALALNATGVLAGLPEEIVTVPFAIKAGIIGGSGKYSYDTMRGAAFRELIMAGVDENTARAAANDEAVVSALIEMADTGFDIATLGIGALITNIGKFGVKQAAKQVAKEGAEIVTEKSLKKVVSALGKYGINIAQEGLEEASQEVISLANAQRALEGGTGKFDLIGSAWDKAQNLTAEEAAQVKEAAEEGMKISAMIGGATAATTGVTNRAIEARNNRIYSDMGATFSETETVDDVIATGLESAPDTESYKLAEKLQAKREAGETITDKEVGRLYAENVKTIREEEAASRKQESKNQPSESVEASDDNFIDEIQKAAQETTQKVAEGSNVLYTASDKFMNEAVRAMAEMEQQRNELKLTDAVKRLGDNGAKALGSYYDNQSNFEDYYNGFSRFYEAGSVGLPMEQVNTVYSHNISPAVQQAAYMAGVNDAKASLARDIANQKVYFPEGKLVQNEYSKQLPKSEVSFYSWLSKITGNVTEFVGANMIGGGLADGSYLNGYVSAEIGTEQARKVVISHEITHGFQMTSPVQYRAYRDYAVQIAEKANGSDTSIVEQYRQRYKTTTEKAMDEVAADFTRTLFENRAEMQKFIEANIHDKKSRNMVQKFFDAVHDFVQKIKKALKGNKAKMDEAAINEFGVTVAELEQARELWLNALKYTQENVKNAKQAVAEGSSVTSDNTHGFMLDEGDAVTRFSLVTDRKLINFLENQEQIVTYKSMQLIDGKLYPPMSAEDKGANGKKQLRPASQLGKWQQADENPDGIKKFAKGGYGVFTLYKGNGKSVDAAYNPYEHSSNLVLNDQFEEAYKRPNLVTVECHIPVSEMTSDYHAEYAKDSTGMHDWKAGVVASKLKENPRKVYLTRWLKPVRVLSDTEVAVKYKEVIGNKVAVPFNVVSPSLLTELEKVGVKIDYEGSPMYKSIQNRKAESEVRFSLKGYDKDGVEVYETSDDTVSLTLKEKRDRLFDLIENEYKGRTAKFVINNDVKYAYLEKRDVRKSIMGDTKSSKAGLDAKINIAADGEYIELVENATYSHSKAETGKAIKAHKGVTDWHYFVKEIASDGVYFNVLINLKQKANGEYVYLVTLRENKNKKGLHPLIASEAKPKALMSGVYNPSNNNKAQNTGDVKYSLKDSSGNTLTEEQAEYFKDSKVRDENGNLFVMYQGNTGDFTVFDRKKSKASNLYGRGFYFTSNESHATQYGNASPYYLNIKKPLMYGQHSITKQQFKNFLKAVEANEDDYGLDNYGYGATAESVLNSVYGKGDFEAIQDVSLTAIGDLVEAVELFNEVNNTNYDGIILPTETVVFNSNQIKNIDNLKPTTDPDIRFSMKKPVEETKNLIALHNVREDKLLEAIKLGGLPSPSIAITKNELLHDKFGDISLIFYKDTISPTNRKNKIYSGDAWTPTRVQVEYDVDDDVLRVFNNKIRELTPEWGSERLPSADAGTADVENDSLAGAYRRRERARMAFLKEKGIAPRTVMRTRNLMSFVQNDTIIAIAKAFTDKQLNDIANTTEGYNQYKNAVLKVIRDSENAIAEKMQVSTESKKEMFEAFAEIYSSERASRFNIEDAARHARNVKKNKNKIPQEVDVYATRDKVEKKFTKKLEAEFDAWVNENTKKAIVNKGIRNNKDLFTSSGNRRSFAALHDPYTLSNIVKNMFADGEKGKALFGGNPIGAAQYEYSSIADVKADADRLQLISDEDYEALEKEINADVFELAGKMKQNSDVFAVKDLLAEAIAKPTKQQANNYLKREAKGWAKYSPEFADELWDIKKRINSMPTGYFEAKPQRAVGFDEVALAVLPKNKKDLKAHLEGLGVEVKTYDPNKEGDRLKKLNSKPDVLFSRKDTSDILKQNARLKEYNDYLKEQMKLTKELKLDKKALEKMARSLIKEYDSNMDATELYDKLNGVYSYLLNTEQPIWEELKSRAVAVARDIVSDATVVNDELYQSYSNLRNYLRTTRISISDVDKRSISDGYNKFRRANFGRINLVTNGSPVDRVYQELAEMHPELFDAEEITHPAEQLEHIVEVLDSLRPYEENPYSYYMNQAAELVANDIIERYYDVPQVKPTFADKQQQKLDKQKYKGAVKLAELKEKNKERIEKIKSQSKERAQQILEKERTKKKDAINKLKTHQKEKEAKMSDKRKRSVLRNQIIRHISPMKEKLLRPSDKNHIPQEMRLTVAAVLDAINLESGYTYDPKTGGYRKRDAGLPTRRTQELEKLKKQYQEILGTDSGAEMVIDPSLLGDTAAGIGSNLDKLIDMRDVRLADMTLEQLNTVWEVVRAVEASIIYAGQMLSQQKYETTSSFANAFASDTETRKNRKSIGSKRVSLDLENPYTFFSHFGQAGKDFFRMLRNAQDEAKLIDIELAERMREVVSSEQRKSLEKDLQTFKTVSGDELTLSKAHIMNIYLLSKRPQAEGHLLRGGIVQPEINRKIHRGTDAVQLTAQDLSELFKLLTAEEKKIADGMQKLTLFLAEKGNEATMKVYGYEKFTDPNYWTIKSAKEGVLQTVEEGQDLARSIRNMGSAKQTVPNASNPLEIKSAFEVFDAHASDMITYSVWLAPMEDSTRLFNFRFRDAGENLTGKTMKGLLNRVGGAGSDAYWMNLMRDIQNGISSPTDDVMSMVINKTIGNVKKAAVAGNIRVIVQQPTAYLRAMVVLSPADLIAGVVKELGSGVTRNGGWKKAVKYAPIAAIKQAGGFEVSASPAQLSEVLYSPNTKKGKVVQFIKDLPFAGASAADAITWGAIWNACETQVARTQKDLVKDSDSFNKAVKELFTEVIDQSQVVDGVLQRSQIMRSSNALNKQATSYMGEPTTALNMFMRCYDAWVNETSPEKRKAALKNIGRAAVALMASNVVVAIAQSSADALRDDEEDKEYLERFMTALTGITGDEETLLDIGKNIVLSGNIGNQMNPATYIPYVKDIVSILQGYTVERMDTGVYSDLISATENVMKSFNGEGKWTKGYAVAKMLTIGAKLFGSSSANVMRDIESIVRSLFIETDDWQALYDMEKQMYDVNKQKSRFLDILYQAMKAGDMDTYNAIVTDLVAAGVKPTDIKNGMSSRAKKDEEVSTEASDFDSTLAGLGLKYNYLEEEETEEEKFTVDNLSGDEYVRYNEVSTQMLEDIISDLQYYGLGDLDEETANALINAAYSYVNNIALEDASGGEYEIDTKWIIGAESAEDDLGLSVAEYIMLKEEYGASALTTEGIFTAYNGGVDPELYLEVKDNINDMKADKDEDGNSISGSKKNKVIEYLNTLGLTEEEYGVLMEAAGYKNPFE